MPNNQNYPIILAHGISHFEENNGVLYRTYAGDSAIELFKEGASIVHVQVRHGRYSSNP